VVKRVRACKVTEYYEILAVKRECDEADVKKAYRKVSHSFMCYYDARPTSLNIVGTRITPRQKWCARR
jgi:preprotein translocase subunit Sec63